MALCLHTHRMKYYVLLSQYWYSGQENKGKNHGHKEFRLKSKLRVKPVDNTFTKFTLVFYFSLIWLGRFGAAAVLMLIKTNVFMKFLKLPSHAYFPKIVCPLVRFICAETIYLCTEHEYQQSSLQFHYYHLLKFIVRMKTHVFVFLAKILRDMWSVVYSLKQSFCAMQSFWSHTHTGRLFEKYRPK